MRILNKFRIFIFITLAFFMVFSSSASAISSALIQSLDSGISFFDPNTCGTNSFTGTAVTPGTGPTAWTANVSTPYYLEEYVINVLEDVAQNENVPTSDTVTQEHVVALVAWAWDELGNIRNNSAFNVWNAGFLPNYPQLFAGGTGNSNGSETSYASFDDAVQASAIIFGGPYQDRIGSILSNPTSTAEEVMQTIAFYDEYAGNKAWSWGNDPTDPQAVLQHNHTEYINGLLSDLQIVRSNYSYYASVELGPNVEGNAFVPVKDIQYNGGVSNVVPTDSDLSSGGCGGVSSQCQLNDTSVSGPNSAILCEAEKYSGIYYFLGGGHEGYSTFRQQCPEASLSSAAASSTVADPGPCATDCSGLISVAVDGAYNQSFSWTVSDSTGQMVGEGAQYWQNIPMSQAQAGDIVTSNDGAGSAAVGTDGHVEIVVSISGNNITTFGSHYTGSQTGEVTQPISDWNTGAWRWTGPGSSS